MLSASSGAAFRAPAQVQAGAFGCLISDTISELMSNKSLF